MSCDGSRRVGDKYGRRAFCFAGPFVWNSFTCRILAGWPLRNSVTTSRSSRHQSKNRPVFFARSRSSLVLKPFTVFAVAESLSSVMFHLDTARWEKKNFLISLVYRHLTSFNECPRVLPANNDGRVPWCLTHIVIKLRDCEFFEILASKTSSPHSPPTRNLVIAPVLRCTDKPPYAHPSN